MIEGLRQPLTIERDVGDDSDAGIGDLLPADGPLVDEEVEVTLRDATVRAVVSQLPDPEREVIQLRFGLDGDRQPVSVRETARRLGVRPADVQRIERHGLEELALRREVAALREAA